MQQPDKKYFTLQEYLKLEEAAEYKSEYYQGEAYAMAGSTSNHNQIIINTVSEFHQAYNKHKCRIFTNDLRLWVNKEQLFTYPDLMVVYNNIEYYSVRNDTITSPISIIEVLSKSTEAYDHGKKFQFYISVPSFQEYILIDQYSTFVKQFTIRPKTKWQSTEYNDIKDIFVTVQHVHNCHSEGFAS